LFIHDKYVSIWPEIFRGKSMFKINEYFDGKVKSIAFQGRDKPATVGVMAAGEYVFNTSEREKMTVVSGELSIQRAGESVMKKYKASESFEVEADSAFNVSVPADCAYLCVYG
jgi:uncharacterized protein YaiE (UPF0345 family)